MHHEDCAVGRPLRLDTHGSVHSSTFHVLHLLFNEEALAEEHAGDEKFRGNSGAVRFETERDCVLHRLGCLLLCELGDLEGCWESYTLLSRV